MAHFHHCSFLFLIFFFYLPTWFVHGEVANGGHQDLQFLLSFKGYNSNATALETWAGPNPCSGSWVGVRCYRGRVVGVFLNNALLVGSVAPLLGLTQIRVLAIRKNSLSGHLPLLDNSTSPNLRHLLLSHNKLSGSLGLSLPSLLTLRAEHNGFHGGLEAVRVPMVRSFNVSRNKLAGEISGDLSRFPSSSFGGNLALCGKPLPRCVHAYNALEDSNQSPSAATNTSSGLNSSSNGGFSRISLSALVATGIGNAVLITISLAISVAMFIYMRRNLRSPKDASSSAALCFEVEDKIRNGEKCQKSGGSLVCFDGGEELRLESLLKASAEVLGKGVSGSTYKAALEDGIVVAVKRLSALRFPGRSKAFDRHMRLVGRLRHRHVVGLRGYCNSNGERLLVYDFLPNGSLQSLLRGNGGGGARSLDWATRKSVLFGAAQGLDYIHTFPARPALVHGNVKPSNILLDEHGGACVSECGLMRYAVNIQQSIPQPRCPPELFLDRAAAACREAAEATPTAASSRGWHGYAAPELASGAGARATQESDVYSFGMVLLEVVTDKAADGGEEEGEGEETMGMVKIGMLCTAEVPEERPRMAQVLTMMSEFM